MTSGDPKLSVAIPADCERLATPVADPEFKEGDDARAALAKFKAAKVQDDARLADTRACEARMRARFAKGG